MRTRCRSRSAAAARSRSASRPSWARTQAPSHSVSTGQTRAHVPPSRFSAKIAPRGALRVAVARSRRRTRERRRPAGHAAAQGAGAYGPPHSRQDRLPAAPHRARVAASELRVASSMPGVSVSGRPSAIGVGPQGLYGNAASACGVAPMPARLRAPTLVRMAATDTHTRQPDDRPGGRAARHRGRRGRSRSRARRARALRPLQGKGSAGRSELIETARRASSSASRRSRRRRPAKARRRRRSRSTDGLWRLGQRAALCLREPSLGPGVRRQGRRGRRRSRTDRARWRTSTSTSPATSTRSARRTTCWPRCSTRTSCTATAWASTRSTITWRRCLDMDDRALRSITARPRRREERRAARHRLRHHGRFRGDGSALRRPRPSGPS